MVAIKKLSVFLMLLLIKSCIAAKDSEIFHNSENTSIVHDAMMKIAKSCFVDRLNPTIATSDLTNVIHETSWDSGSMPVISIDKDFKSDGIHQYYPQLATFALSANSVEDIESLLLVLESSPWWNIDALLIIGGTSAEACANPSTILRVAWKMNMLSALLVCHQVDEGVMLYTFNPYTNRAPRLWKKMENVEPSDARWTMYKQLYVKGREFCESLNFDKMKFMDGYQIKAVANPRSGETAERNKDYGISSLMKKLSLMDAMYFTTLFSVLNITSIIRYDSPGFWINGTAEGFLSKLVNGTYDIALSVRPLSENMTATYTVDQIPVHILTCHRNFLLPLEKIANFYSIKIVYLTSVVLLITFVTMVIFQKYRVGSATFEILRLVLSTGILQPLNKIAVRIYFFGVLYLIIILNATFQGNLSAFLTKPERHDIETLNDVETHHYRIYVPNGYESIEENWSQSLKKYVIHVDEIDCVKYILNDHSAACIQIRTRLLAPAEKYGLHISRGAIDQPYTSYWCRKDWPLTNKFSSVALRLLQSGIISHWEIEGVRVSFEKLKNKEAQETAAIPRVIELQDLAFALQFLVIGLTISTLIFVIEVFPTRLPLRAMKKQRNIMFREKVPPRRIILYPVSKS